MLTTIGAVKDYKAVSETSVGALTMCLKSADAWIKARIGTPVESDTYTSRLSGEGVAMLRLPHWPLISISSLVVDGSAWTVLAGTDADTNQDAYADENGLIWARNGQVFARGYGNVLVTYAAGYATVPFDLQMACIILTHLIFAESTRVGVGGKTLGPEQINLMVRNVKDYDTLIEQPIRNARRGF